MTNSPIKTALLSVTDKTGLVDFANTLQSEFGVQLVASGGTAKTLQEAGLNVTLIEDWTGHPEMFDGRVKTLHPKVHGGILFRRDDKKHVTQAAEHDIRGIDLVVVNLYAFEDTIAQSNVTKADAIEHIDIGGPALLRSAAKNHNSVTVVPSPSLYDKVLRNIRDNKGATTQKLREELAGLVYATTAKYDSAIADYFAKEIINDSTNVDASNSTCRGDQWLPNNEERGANTDFSHTALSQYNLYGDNLNATILRYGENPHQQATLVSSGKTGKHTLSAAKQLVGKELSYNNYLDLNAALTSVREFAGTPAAVIVKHLTPCGIAVAPKLVDAYSAAWKCDTTSAFGGVMAFNQTVTPELIQAILDNGQFVEAIIAPEYEQAALDLYVGKPNVRLLELDEAGFAAPSAADFEIKSVDGGLLIENIDTVSEKSKDFTIPTQSKPSKEQLACLDFAWRAVKCVKSNAIVIAQAVAKDTYATVGMGAGQPNRVNSAGLAVAQAGPQSKGAVAASDAFLPFADTLETLAEAGVVSLIQPGGSVRDDEVIAIADKLGVSMVFTGHRHFRH